MRCAVASSSNFHSQLFFFVRDHHRGVASDYPLLLYKMYETVPTAASDSIYPSEHSLHTSSSSSLDTLKENIIHCVALFLATPELRGAETNFWELLCYHHGTSSCSFTDTTSDIQSGEVHE